MFHTSHNESILSSTIMTNIVNLDYVVTDKTEENEKLLCVLICLISNALKTRI